MIPAATPVAAGVDEVEDPQRLPSSANKAEPVRVGTRPVPPSSQENQAQADRTAGAAIPPLLSSTGGGVSFHHPTPQPRERSVLSLCGKRKVWTNDRTCGCGVCEVLR